ncbi:MAG: hypothetical protein NVS1B13_19210 [Flavisolibacter sp.]
MRKRGKQAPIGKKERKHIAFLFNQGVGTTELCEKFNRSRGIVYQIAYNKSYKPKQKELFAKQKDLKYQ